MRIGQLARKYDIPVQDVLDYLKEIGADAPHPNARLFEAVETQVLTHFGKSPDITTDEMEEDAPTPQEEIARKSEPMSAAEEILAVDGEIEDREYMPAPKEEPETIAEITSDEPKSLERKPEEIIQTDQLLEMLESGEIPADLDKIKLIKAPKRELAGLKVLGKVDLPEPKKKPTPEERDANRKSRQPQRPQLSEEEKEKRRLREKKKREEMEARKEKRRKEQEKQQLKKAKEEHYRKKVQKVAKVTEKKSSPVLEEKPVVIQAPAKREVRKEPKSLLGKFWNWLNT